MEPSAEFDSESDFREVDRVQRNLAKFESSAVRQKTVSRPVEAGIVAVAAIVVLKAVVAVEAVVGMVSVERFVAAASPAAEGSIALGMNQQTLMAADSMR